MVTTDEQRKYDLVALLHSFGEPISYRPHLGAARSIVAILKRDELLRDNGTGKEGSEVLSVTVLRDPTFDQLGGIDAPDIHDVVEVTSDPERRQFKFTGNVLRKHKHGWTLEFRSTRQKRMGRLNVS